MILLSPPNIVLILPRYKIDPNRVGRLEVGTETLVDKSKSTKTVLMDLFPGNTDIEGATVVNACYGGTAALLNAVAWCESSTSNPDGRYAIVVAADIAAYARGPARPTCGVGAVAMLVGHDAPIVMSTERATHASNVWDFFKPDHTVEYPTVDGALSQVCYYRALEDVYERFADKMEKSGGGGTGNAAYSSSRSSAAFDADTPDYFVFHAPYNKLVQKSFARLFLIDARRQYQRKKAKTGTVDEEEKKEVSCHDVDRDGEKEAGGSVSSHPLQEWLEKPIEDTYSDRALEGALKKLSAESFKRRASDANAASKVVGNTYTASVFLGLASLIDRVSARGELTPGKSIVMFSYGSGALATMYRFQV